MYQILVWPAGIDPEECRETSKPQFVCFRFTAKHVFFPCTRLPRQQENSSRTILFILSTIFISGLSFRTASFQVQYSPALFLHKTAQPTSSKQAGLPESDQLKVTHYVSMAENGLDPRFPHQQSTLLQQHITNFLQETYLSTFLFKKYFFRQFVNIPGDVECFLCCKKNFGTSEICSHFFH